MVAWSPAFHPATQFALGEHDVHAVTGPDG
jgi:hypothetical protein